MKRPYYPFGRDRRRLARYKALSAERARSAELEVLAIKRIFGVADETREQIQ